MMDKVNQLTVLLLLSTTIFVLSPSVNASDDFILSWIPLSPEWNGSHYNVTIRLQFTNLTRMYELVRYDIEYVHGEETMIEALMFISSECSANKGTLNTLIQECNTPPGVSIVKLFDAFKPLKISVWMKDAIGSKRSEMKMIGFSYPMATKVMNSTQMPRKAGQSIALNCSTPNAQNVQQNFTWYALDVTSAPREYIPIRENQDWHNFLMVENDYFSTLNGILRPGDEGYYQCVVENARDVLRSDLVFVNITYPPIMNWRKPYQSSHVIRKGELVSLEWHILAIPRPEQVFWYREDVEISKNDPRFVKEISGSGPEYTYKLKFFAMNGRFGAYRCLTGSYRGATAHFTVIHDVKDLKSKFDILITALVVVTIIFILILAILMIRYVYHFRKKRKSLKTNDDKTDNVTAIPGVTNMTYSGVTTTPDGMFYENREVANNESTTEEELYEDVDAIQKF